MKFFKPILKYLLTKPVIRIANKFSSAPKKENVFASLTNLYAQSVDQPNKKSGSMLASILMNNPLLFSRMNIKAHATARMILNMPKQITRQRSTIIMNTGFIM